LALAGDDWLMDAIRLGAVTSVVVIVGGLGAAALGNGSFYTFIAVAFTVWSVFAVLAALKQ
jgi:hypothetical protein